MVSRLGERLWLGKNKGTGMCMNLALRSRDLYNLLVILFSFPAGSDVSHTPADRKCFVVYDSHGRYRFFKKLFITRFFGKDKMHFFP